MLSFRTCSLFTVALTMSATALAGQSGGGPSAADPAQPPTEQTPSPPASSPLAIHVGDAELLIGGFMDGTVVVRSTNPGTGLGSSFGSIPFTTTAAGAPNPTGNLSETRFSAQNSRITLQATSKVGSASLKGYLEADFLGNTSTNIDVTSNSNGLRMRLYWAQFTSGKFEFLAGQSWSLMTPNRNGLSPAPGDLYYSQDVDTNYQSGLIWGRTMGFRFIAHPNDAVTAGFALENPEQYVGGAVVLPAAFPAGEVNTGTSTLAASSPVPNVYPDIIGKIALDPKTGGTHQHIDAAFLIRGYKTFNPGSSATATETGTGGSVNVVLEPLKDVRLIATNFFSNGGGRYIANTNIPDFIVNADQTMSLVKSWSGIYGAEITVKKSLLYGYYSVVRATENTAFDVNGKTPIGFGIAGSQTANEKVNEASVGITQTLFRDAKIGGMQLMLQYSNVQRTPFAVPAGTPSDAKMNMVYVNVRYILP
jgi:hypothetical protein